MAVSRNLNHYYWGQIQTKNFQTISDIIYLQFTVFKWKFDSPKVKRILIFSTISFVYKFRHEAPNSEDLGN